MRNASPALRNDKEVVLAAVARHGEALKHASEALQSDKEVVLAAVAQDSHALASWNDHKVPEALQQDPVVQRLGLDGSERALPHELLRLKLFGHLQYLPKMLDEGITVEMLPSLGHDRLEALEAVPRIREILRLTIMTDDCGGYYWGPFHPRAQDEPWMAAERERRGRRDERYDPAAVARLWEEGERAREEAGEASAAAASQPASPAACRS